LLICLLLAACNLPVNSTAQETGAAESLPSPTPYEEVEGEFEPLSDFFIARLDEGVPQSWGASEDWKIEDSILKSTVADSEITISGLWGNYSLFARLRYEGQGTAQFRLRDDQFGHYLIELGPDNIVISWRPAEGGAEQFGETGSGLTPEWHDLAIRLDQNVFELGVDDVTVIKLYDFEKNASGSLALRNAGEGTLQMESLSVGPASVGPGAVSPTPAPTSASPAPEPVTTDLAVDQIGMSTEGGIFVVITNLGSQALSQNLISANVEDSKNQELLGSMELALDLEPDESTLVFFTIFTEGRVADKTIEAKIEAIDFTDPNKDNDSLIQNLTVTE